MNFIRNRKFRAGPQTSLEGFICPQNSDKQQKIKVFGRSEGGVKIGDNVMLGAGSKILNGVTIGDNAKVGANCVVVQDIPADATCVLPKSRIIIKNEK